MKEKNNSKELIISEKANSQEVLTFSTNPNREGRVLILAVGGAGIPNTHYNLNENLREALEKIPYLVDSAQKIDYLALLKKDSADMTA